MDITLYIHVLYRFWFCLFGFYAAITSPVLGFNTSHLPPAASMAARAVFVKAWACTVMSLAVNSLRPTTILWVSYLDLVTALASNRDSKLQVSPGATPFRLSSLMMLYCFL